MNFWKISYSIKNIFYSIELYTKHWLTAESWGTHNLLTVNRGVTAAPLLAGKSKSIYSEARGPRAVNGRVTTASLMEDDAQNGKDIDRPTSPTGRHVFLPTDSPVGKR